MHNRVALSFVLVLSFVMAAQGVRYELPLSYDVWYHLQISRQFSEGEFFYDTGSFGPEGRPHTYPPLFHLMTALFSFLVPPVELARFLPPLLVVLSTYSFYILSRKVLDEKVALLSCLFASVCPILLDRGMSYTPEVLSFTVLNLGLASFWEGKWKTTGVLGGLLLLTHGLSSIAFFSVLLMYTFSSLSGEMVKKFLCAAGISLLIFSVWAWHSYPTHIPYGGIYPLVLYPEKLGWIQTLLAFLGVTALAKDRKSRFVLSYAGALFLLSRNPVSLPYRFVEFLAFPLCMLAGMGAYALKDVVKVNARTAYLSFFTFLFFIAFANGYWSVEKYRPMVTGEERGTFSWLDANSVEGYTVISQWRTAPALAYFSGRAPVKGAYEIGAPSLRERTEDTQLFYTQYPEDLLSKYQISHIYYGIEERGYGYGEPPFDKVYSTQKTGFYHR